MNAHNDGGPAFPNEIEIRTINSAGDLIHTEKHGRPGMSLRDYFAGQLLMGWLVSRESDVALHKCGGDPREAAAEAAGAAYVIAQAMVDVRGELE